VPLKTAGPDNSDSSGCKVFFAKKWAIPLISAGLKTLSGAIREIRNSTFARVQKVLLHYKFVMVSLAPRLELEFYRSRVLKRVLNSYAVVSLAMAEVFGIDYGASKPSRRGDDGGVVVIDLVAVAQSDGVIE
jgi:hypothetical protein